MRKTSIGIGAIIALVLLYSCPAFAGDDSLGAKGMLSSGEMRAINNAGGVIGASRSDRGAAPADVTLNGKTMTVNEVKGVIGSSFVNSDAGQAFRTKTAASTTPENFRNNSNFGLGRGHSEATGAAVTALRAYAPPSSPVSPVSNKAAEVSKPFEVNGRIYVDTGTSCQELKKPFVSVTTAGQPAAGQPAGGHWEAHPMAGSPDLGIEADAKIWVSDKSTPVVPKATIISSNVPTNPTNPLLGGSSERVNIGGNIRIPKSAIDSTNALTQQVNRPL